MRFVLIVSVFTFFIIPNAFALTSEIGGCGFGGKGINFSNQLELPRDRVPSELLLERDFRAVSLAGFRTVRVPIAWHEYAAEEAPYKLDQDIFRRVDSAIRFAQKYGLTIILDFHGFKPEYLGLEKSLDRFVAIWRQVSEHYRSAPDNVVFELLNEPHGALTARIWSRWQSEAIKAIRVSNPSRTLIVSGVYWGKVEGLGEVEVPNDPKLVVSIHYYAPAQLTHQGAKWIVGADKWVGTKWSASNGEVDKINRDLSLVDVWRQTHKVAGVIVGEFGVVRSADPDSRKAWIGEVRRAAEARGWCWAYWEFKSGFGIYDDVTMSWDIPILRALVP